MKAENYNAKKLINLKLKLAIGNNTREKVSNSTI